MANDRFRKGKTIHRTVKTIVDLFTLYSVTGAVEAGRIFFFFHAPVPFGYKNSDWHDIIPFQLNLLNPLT